MRCIGCKAIARDTQIWRVWFSGTIEPMDASALSQLKIRVRRTSSQLTNSGTDALEVHRTGFNSTLILSCDKALVPVPAPNGS